MVEDKAEKLQEEEGGEGRGDGEEEKDIQIDESSHAGDGERGIKGWMDENPEMKVEGRRVILVTFQAGVVTSCLYDCWHRHNIKPVKQSGQMGRH